MVGYLSRGEMRLDLRSLLHMEVSNDAALFVSASA